MRTMHNPGTTHAELMKIYFANEEICECGHTRKEHKFDHEVTDYICDLTYICPDGEKSTISIF